MKFNYDRLRNGKVVVYFENVITVRTPKRIRTTTSLVAVGDPTSINVNLIF